MAGQIINSNVHRFTDEESVQHEYQEQQMQSWLSYGHLMPDWLWQLMQKTDPSRPGRKSLLDYIAPENTMIGKTLRGDPSDLASFPFRHSQDAYLISLPSWHVNA